MMPLLVSLALAAAALTGAIKVDRSEERLQAALRVYAQGNFAAALKELDRAAAEAKDDALLARIHLARGQCFAAFSQFERAEEAFAQALTYDPTVRLDPLRVLPTIVSLLDGLRLRLRGELSVVVDPPGAALTLDARPLGTAPFRGPVSIGAHTLEARSAGGRSTTRDLVVRSNRTLELMLVLEPATDPSAAAGTTSAPATRDGLRLFGEIRASIDPKAGLAPEAGAGIGGRHWFVSIQATVGTMVGGTTRLGVRFPDILGPVGLYASIDAPIFFARAPAKQLILGIGGAAGVVLAPVPPIEVFAEIDGRKHQAYDNFRNSYLLIGAGLRVRLL